MVQASPQPCQPFSIGDGKLAGREGWAEGGKKGGREDGGVGGDRRGGGKNGGGQWPRRGARPTQRPKARDCASAPPHSRPTACSLQTRPQTDDTPDCAADRLRRLLTPHGASDRRQTAHMRVRASRMTKAQGAGRNQPRHRPHRRSRGTAGYRPLHQGRIGRPVSHRAYR